MSGMADEMARRIAEDGGAGLPASASGVPGTGGEDQGQPPAPAAEPSTTDTAGGTPESIPYARFKEVNDRYSELKGYEQLREYGYDPDSLGRLVAFEAQYLQDPIGVWMALADNLDLPQGLKEALESHLSGQQPSPGRAEGEPSGSGTPSSEQDPKIKEALEWIESRKAAERDAAEQRLLDQTINHWDELDKQEGIETPEAIKLAHISAVANSGTVFRSAKEIAEAARRAVVEYRSTVLGGAVRTGREGSPLAVPGSPLAATPPVDFGGDIKAASRAAAAAMERGELPQITPGA